MKKLSTFLLSVMIGSAALAQNSQRLVGLSVYSDPTGLGTPFILTDTAHFAYSGNRGSVYDFNRFLFTSPDAFEYNYLWQTPAPNNTYDYVDLVSADVLSYYHRNETSSLMELASKKGIAYDAAGKPTDEGIELYGSSNIQAACFYSYDALDRICGVLYLSNSGGATMDTVARKGIRYQPGGGLMMDSTDNRNAPGVWTPAFRNHYATWPNGDLQQKSYLEWDGAFWYESMRDSFSYNSNGTVKKAWYFWNGTVTASASLKQIDSFAYTNGIDNYTFRQSWYLSGGVPELIGRFQSWHNPAMIPDSFVSYSYEAGVWKPAYGSALDVNSAGNPTTQRKYEVLSGNYQAYARYHYYYEGYTPTGIAPAVQGQSAMQVFPNPVGHALNISWKGLAQSMPCDLVLTNVAGQVLMRSRCAAGVSTYQVDFTAFVAGSYFVVLSQSGRVVARQQVVKQ